MTDVTVSVGDIVHFSDPSLDPIPPPALPTLPPTVAELLAASRLAHARFQTAAGSITRDGTVRDHPDDAAAALAVLEALTTREAADAADLAHSDPAWSVDQQANRGVSSADLLAFYRDYLQP